MTSNPFAISTFCVELMKYKPISSVLEIGPGAFCKYGLLCREYISAWGPHKFKKSDWTFTMDCIEVYKPYISDLHYFLYDNVFIENVLNIDFNKMQQYDVIIMMDVIEHFEKEVALNLLTTLNEKCNKAIFIGTPSVPSFRGKFGKDDYEAHLSFIEPNDLYNTFKNEYIQIFDTSGGVKGFETYLGIIAKDKPGELK